MLMAAVFSCRPALAGQDATKEKEDKAAEGDTAMPEAAAEGEDKKEEADETEAGKEEEAGADGEERSKTPVWIVGDLCEVL